MTVQTVTYVKQKGNIWCMYTKAVEHDQSNGAGMARLVAGEFGWDLKAERADMCWEYWTEESSIHVVFDTEGTFDPRLPWEQISVYFMQAVCVYFRMGSRWPQWRRSGFRSRSQHHGEWRCKLLRWQQQNRLWCWRLAQCNMRNQVSSERMFCLCDVSLVLWLTAVLFASVMCVTCTLTDNCSFCLCGVSLVLWQLFFLPVMCHLYFDTVTAVLFASVMCHLYFDSCSFCLWCVTCTLTL